MHGKMILLRWISWKCQMRSLMSIWTGCNLHGLMMLRNLVHLEIIRLILREKNSRVNIGDVSAGDDGDACGCEGTTCFNGFHASATNDQSIRAIRDIPIIHTSSRPS